MELGRKDAHLEATRVGQGGRELWRRKQVTTPPLMVPPERPSLRQPTGGTCNFGNRGHACSYVYLTVRFPKVRPSTVRPGTYYRSDSTTRKRPSCQHEHHHAEQQQIALKFYRPQVELRCLIAEKTTSNVCS